MFTDLLLGFTWIFYTGYCLHYLLVANYGLLISVKLIFSDTDSQMPCGKSMVSNVTFLAT